MAKTDDSQSVRDYVDQTLETLHRGNTPHQKVDERLLLLFFLQELKTIGDRLATVETLLFGEGKVTDNQ